MAILSTWAADLHDLDHHSHDNSRADLPCHSRRSHLPDGARIERNLPHYTGMAQDYIYIARSYIIRGADMVVKPVIDLEGFIEKIKAFFERISTI